MGLFNRLFRKNNPAAPVSELPQPVKPRVALVLGGGGARGYGHIGAIKAFEEEGFEFDMVVGTSVGALVGALYAGGISSRELISFSSALDLKDVRSGFFLKQADPFNIGKIAAGILGDVNIEDLRIPFYAISVDLVEARQVILDKGKVSFAVSASCCVPGLFAPVIDGPRHLVDGGLLNNIPAETARMLGADRVVAIDINPTRGGGTDKTGTIDVIKAMISIMGANSSQNGVRFSDVMIAPDMGKFRASQKEGYEEMIERGYLAAKEQADAIRKLFAPIIKPEE